MKNNRYSNAVDHLQFSDDFASSVMKRAEEQPRRRNPAAILILAAVIALMATTALAESTDLRVTEAEQEKLGTVLLQMKDAEKMDFMKLDAPDGVKVHTLQLPGGWHHSFEYGLLYTQSQGFFRVTDDYRLEKMEYETMDIDFEKNGRVYNFDYNCNYVQSDGGIITMHGRFLEAVNGEVLIPATDGNSNQWPVFWNLENHTYRDALPGLTEEDFKGRISYAQWLNGDILVSTVVGESYNELYLVDVDTMQIIPIELPSRAQHNVDDGILYCNTPNGAWYRYSNSGTFELIDNFSTNDHPSGGLLTVATAKGELGIYDMLRDETIVIEGISVEAYDMRSTVGYNATRYRSDGNIMISHVTQDMVMGVRKLDQLLILNPETGTLKKLQIESDADINRLGSVHGWLDEYRYAAICTDENGNYLCIYEFTS